MMDNVSVEYRLEDIDSNVKNILTLLNGRDGIVTTLMIQQEKIKDIPTPNTLKCYAAVGGGITSALSIIAWALFSIFKHA